jgi:hypothetical protein
MPNSKNHHKLQALLSPPEVKNIHMAPQHEFEQFLDEALTKKTSLIAILALIVL